jgi:hypothetical protein
VRGNIARSIRRIGHSVGLTALMALAGCLGTMGESPEVEDEGVEGEVEPPEGEEGEPYVMGEDELPLEEESIDESVFEQGVAEWYQTSTTTTVGDLVSAHGCSTGPTMPLNAQIAEQMNCIEGGYFARIDDIANVDLGAGATPFLQAPAAAALRRAAETRPSSTLSISSSWRSVVQQYVLYSWRGSCGISAAAAPGGSNHESGLAIDVPLDTTTTFRTALKTNRFRWYCDATNGGRSSGCGDRPHHDYIGGGTDLRSRSVLAFQQLWNRAHPEDRIAEDGAYGPATAARIRRAPVGGFATGTTCEPEPTDFCGNGTCGDAESCESCPDDCGACLPVCADGVCEADETCSSCPADCGDCPTVCGNGSCETGETCEACPGDCGACPEPAGCDVDGHGGVGENGDPCAEAPETWRCVTSERWDDTISQVCRGGRWVTFELHPRDCAACCGEYSIACRP